MSSSTFKPTTFDANLSNCFSVIDNENKDKIFSNLLSSRDRNFLHDILADHFKAQYDSFINDKQYNSSHTVSVVLSASDQQALCDAFPGIQLTFSRKFVHPHAYACASRSLEFINILYERIRYNKASETTLYPNLLRVGGWDVLVKDVGGNPVNSLNHNLSSYHSCSPIIKTNSYDSIRQTSRIVDLLLHSSTNHEAKSTILHGIQDDGPTTVYNCSQLSQHCNIKAPFVMFVHSLYDMTLLDVANTMDEANALIGYGSIIYSDEILINPRGEIKPLGVWWEYTQPLDNEQWSHERTLFHTKGNIRFGFDKDDGFNYVHSLANYKSYFTTSRFVSSNNVVYNLELLDNRNGIQFIKFTRELVTNIVSGVDHSINLKSLNNKYILSFYEWNLARKSSPITPTPVHRFDPISWHLPITPSIVPVRFAVSKKPIDDTISFLTTVKDNLKPSEVLNYIRTNAQRQIVNGSVIDNRLNLDHSQLAVCARALYLCVYNSNYHSGKIVQQAIADVECTRKVSLMSALFQPRPDHLALSQSRFIRFFISRRNHLASFVSFVVPSTLSYLAYKAFKFISNYRPFSLTDIISYVSDNHSILLSARLALYTYLIPYARYFIHPLPVFALSYFLINRSLDRFSLNDVDTTAFLTVPKTRYLFQSRIYCQGKSHYILSVPVDADDEKRDEYVRTMTKSIYNVDFKDLDARDILDVFNSINEDQTKSPSPVVIETPEKPISKLDSLSDLNSLFLLRDRVKLLSDDVYYTTKKKMLKPLPSDCINRSQAKLRDILSYHFGFTTDNALDLCSAPGGFVLELSKIFKSVHYKQYESKNIRMHPSVKRLPNAKSTNFQNGDMLDDFVIDKYLSEDERYDLVTADGAIENHNDDPEEINHSLLINQCKVALHCLKPGGWFIVKIFDAIHSSTISLIQHLSDQFSETVYFNSSWTSPISSEFYIIYKNFGQTPMSPITHSLNSFLNSNYSRLKVNFEKFLKLSNVDSETKSPSSTPEIYSGFYVRKSPADGNCCFHASLLNRQLNLSEFKTNLKKNLRLSPDLTEELTEGNWGGSAYLDAFGQYAGVTYIVHNKDNIYRFGDSTGHREIHLRLHDNHYDLLSDPHSGTPVSPVITSFPCFDHKSFPNFINQYINISNPNGVQYSGNLQHTCDYHNECLNNSFTRVINNSTTKTNLLFLIEKDRGMINIDIINQTLKSNSLSLRFHVIYHKHFYFVTTHNATTHTDISLSHFDLLDKHMRSCVCSSDGFVPKPSVIQDCFVYYCRTEVNEFIEYQDGVSVDLTVNLLDINTKPLSAPSNSFNGREVNYYLTIDETRRSVNDDYGLFERTLRTNLISGVQSILINTYCVNPNRYFQIISSLFPNVAQKYFRNYSHSSLRSPHNSLLETSDTNIQLNAMEERRSMWLYSINYVKESLQSMHKVLMSLHNRSLPLLCDKLNHNFYDVANHKLLIGRNIDLNKVKWAWDGESLFTFDHIRNVHKYTSSSFISFNPDSVLLTGYHHYQLTKNLDVPSVRNAQCQFFQVQGVPGAGKTEFILRSNAESSNTLLLTVSRTAAEDMRARALKICKGTVTIATFDSFMINFNKLHSKGYTTVWFDEALLTHGGDWLWVAALTNCKQLYIVGDQAQIPYIDRTKYSPKYITPKLPYSSTKELCKSYRCPLDIVHWMNVVRDSDGSPLYSFTVVGHTGSALRTVSSIHISSVSDVPFDDEAQYLTFTQAEQLELHNHFNLPKDSGKIRTIHQYQGNQSKKIILVRTEIKDTNKIYVNMKYILVALSRHTSSFRYCTVSPSDATSLEIARIRSFTDAEIRLCGGGSYDTYHKNLTVTPPSSQMVYTYPKIVRDLNDIYAFGSYLPLCVRSHYKTDIKFKSDPIVPSPLSFAVEYIQDIHDRILGPAPQNEFDHHIYQASDKYYHGEFSIIPKLEIVRQKPFCPPKLITNMRPKAPSNQCQVVKAFIERNGAVPRLSGDVNEIDTSNFLFDTVCKVLDPDLINMYRANPITVNCRSIAIWLSKQPQNVHNLILSETQTLWDKDLTSYYFTIKGNPKPDLDKFPETRYKSSQTIAYQDKLINAIFCPLMSDFTDRLLAALNDNIILFNRMSNDDFCNAVDKVCPFERFAVLNNFIEIDFSKFDKSQDLTALRFETSLMRLIGVPEIYCNLWIIMHKSTTLRDRVNLFKANVEYQRKSGDAGTWVLNTLFQMAVVLSACQIEDKILKGSAFCVFSGDDSLVFTDSLSVSKAHIAHTCSNLYNLEVKLLDYQTPYFCSKFFIPTERGLLFIPDLLKTIVKLGRKDIVNQEHAKEYFISFADNNIGLNDANNWPLISKSFSDRYKLHIDHSMTIQAIYTIANDRDLFLSLWDYSSEKHYNILPKLEL